MNHAKQYHIFRFLAPCKYKIIKNKRILSQNQGKSKTAALSSVVLKSQYFLVLIIMIGKHSTQANTAWSIDPVINQEQCTCKQCNTTHEDIPILDVRGPAVAMVHTKIRSIFRLPNVFLRIVE